MTSLVFLGALIVAGGGGEVLFRAVEIHPHFDSYLRANQLLKALPEAKVLRLDNGKKVVLAVASTVLKDDSAEERMRGERLCQIMTLTSVLAEKQGYR
jgi:transcriptional regulator of aromatic amino acid metabolism